MFHSSYTSILTNHLLQLVAQILVVTHFSDNWRSELLLHIVKHVLEDVKVTMLSSIVTRGFPSLYTHTYMPHCDILST